MSRLSLIRFGTYVLLIVAILLAKKQRYFIPVHLPINGVPFLRMFDPEEYHHGGSSPTGMPGFADTTLSGSAVLRLAEDKVAKQAIPTAEFDYAHPSISLRMIGKQLQWTVTWIARRPPLTDGTIWLQVLIDDRSHETRLERRNDSKLERKKNA